jgi:hypothetical protein
LELSEQLSEPSHEPSERSEEVSERLKRATGGSGEQSEGSKGVLWRSEATLPRYGNPPDDSEEPSWRFDDEPTGAAI